MDITLDRQSALRRCDVCGVGVPVIRGSVFADGEPVGLYLIELHSHSPRGPLCHLAVAIKGDAGTKPNAVAIDVTADEQQYGYSVVDWESSPWKGETYLGMMLSRADALEGRVIDVVFHVAEHVTRDLPEVAAYLNGPA